MARGLAAAGDEVHVFAREAAEGSPAEVHRLDVPRGWQPRRVLAFSRAAARAAPRGAYDAVQSFSRTRHQDVFRAGGGSHADYLDRSFRGLSRQLRRLSPRHRVLLGIERAVFADPTQWILCNSAMVAREIGARYGPLGRRCRIIPNGVDLERFHPEQRERARRALQIDGTATIWLFVGHGFRRKGLDTALRALHLSRDGTSELWVAGGDAVERWRRRAAVLGLASRVRFLGPRDDTPQLYAAADALILPTRYDAFANVTLEASASGCFAVTSRQNGAAEWFGDACAAVENAEDAEAFARWLDRLGDPAERTRLGEAARRRAEDASWPRHISALRALYAEGAPDARAGAPDIPGTRNGG
ncbi:MAG: glycosyltransferase family 4 protein [Myxococcales bacterium]|nr:glycosyltransferase family 4 protein [Myxococcales bacterium]